MESEVRKENDDSHLQKPPKPEGKEKEKEEASSSSSSCSSSRSSQIHDSSKPQSPNTDGYDPNRIPASVFSTKTGGTSSQAEWSGTSNESLFSIQMGMGNSSFSNDYAIMYGKSQDLDLNNPRLKSGELPRLDTNRHNPPPMSPDFTTLAPVMEQEEGSLHSAKRDTTQSPNASPQPNLRISSDSNKSFAFPVLTNVSGKKEQSVKVETERDDEQTEVQEVQVQQPPAQKPNKWFSCFSCSSCCTTSS